MTRMGSYRSGHTCRLKALEALTREKALRTLENERFCQMNAYAGQRTGFGDFGRSVDEWLDRAAAEVRHAVSYVDQVIVPEVRHETGGAMRTVAVHLERWADKLDPQGIRQR